LVLQRPGDLNGPYRSAQFPKLDANDHNQYVAVPMTREFHADGENTSDYTIQSPAMPTSSSADSWQWSVRTSAATALLRVSAVNASGTPAAGIPRVSLRHFVRPRRWRLDRDPLGVERPAQSHPRRQTPGLSAPSATIGLRAQRILPE
jgi:hypothetical protein